MKLLGDIIAKAGGLIQTGPFGSQLHEHEYTTFGIPVVMPKDIASGRIDCGSISHISREKAVQLKRHELHLNDIVFPRRGDISKCALVSAAEEGFLCGTGCLKITVPEAELSPKFLYYFLTLPESVKWLENNSTGSTMMNLNTTIMGRFEVPEVPIEEQRRIAEILSAYDDLIENNRRRIAILEETARLAFQTSIVAGPWKCKPVSELVEVNPDVPTPKYDRIRYIPMSALSTTGMTVDLSDSEMREKSTSVRFVNGDVLLARITPCLENGKTAYVSFLEAGEIGCGSSEFIVLRGKRVSSYFTYCLSRLEAFRGIAIKSMVGASGRQRVQPSCFTDFWIQFPAKETLQEFDDLATPMFKQIAVLSKQNTALAAVRDMLLPRLMKGAVERNNA